MIDRVDENLGGAPRAVRDIAEGAATLGFDAVMYSTRAADDHSTIQIPGVPLTRFPRPRFAKYAFSWPLLRALPAAVAQADLVEIHGIFHVPAVATALLARRSHVPYLIRPHGTLDGFDINRKHRRLKSLLGPLLFRSIIEHAACILTTAPRESKLLITFGARARAQTLPLPVTRVAEPRSSHHKPARLRVLFMGRLEPKKGLERLLYSLAALQASGVWTGASAELMIAGTGASEYVDGLKQLANDLGLDSVRWLGHISGEAKRELLESSHIFVLNSDNENFGIAVVEAAQAGLCLILSSEVYIVDAFLARDACLAPARTAEALAESLGGVLSNAELRVRLAENAALVAGDTYEPEHAWAAHAALRKELMQLTK